MHRHVRERVACWITLGAAALLPASARAFPEPQWTTSWRVDGAPWTTGSTLDRADDGDLYVTLELARAGSNRIALSRLSGQGTLAWTREHVGTHVLGGGAALLPDGPVALIGERGDIGIFAQALDAQGLPVWEHGQPDGRLDLGAKAVGVRVSAIGIHGDLLVRAREGTDLAVLRFAAGSGVPLPAWRWASGLSSIRMMSIAPLADGGAVVAAHGPGTMSGFLTVRFAPDGTVRHADLEAGDIGNPLGHASVFATADDASIVVASPETQLGSPGAMAWKIAADGTRVWTRQLSNQAVLAETFSTGPSILAADGDLLVAVRGSSHTMRLLRVDSTTGVTRWDRSSSMIGDVTSLAEAPNGRILAVGFAFVMGGGGRTTAKLVEFESDGTPCREGEVASLWSFGAAVAGGEGWTVLGSGGESGDEGARLQRYDAAGACTLDPVFADGFDPG